MLPPAAMDSQQTGWFLDKNDSHCTRVQWELLTFREQWLA